MIVNYANPLAELSLEQVRAVFTGAITDWSSLPGKKRGAIAVMARNGNSGTADSFRALALQGAALTPAATLFEDSHALAEAVAADPDAIGFVGWSYLDSGNRALRIGNRGSPARAPQWFSIATEEYLLSRRIYLYASERNAEAGAFLDFVLSDAGRESWSKPASSIAQSSSNGQSSPRKGHPHTPASWPARRRPSGLAAQSSSGPARPARQPLPPGREPRCASWNTERDQLPAPGAGIRRSTRPRARAGPRPRPAPSRWPRCSGRSACR